MNAKILKDAKIRISGLVINTEVIICSDPIGGTCSSPSPSILGVDFLINNKLKFVFDPDKKEAYLEKED
ncbi:MAG: hypothetical protein KKF50_05610 [Nanoarchaeota archaeon]|nr:hypothetical protein [Nanoarchaeota archaeon]